MTGEPLIRLEKVERTFEQTELKVSVLKGVSLEIGAGEFVALQGPSGSGKSTLMHILGLLDRPSAGKYILGGEDVSLLPDKRLSELRNAMLGFVFQTFYLVPYASALENVILPGLYSNTPNRELKERATHLLEKVGLSDRLHFKPGQLSGGQQQRVAMARALVNDPRLLLADEPTGQLDSKTGDGIMELFEEIHREGRTIVLVTHEEKTAAHAERKIVLHDGLVTSNSSGSL